MKCIRIAFQKFKYVLEKLEQEGKHTTIVSINIIKTGISLWKEIRKHSY